MSLAVGTTISHYRVDASLGAGGMGEVYKAYDTLLERAVALKILPADLVGDQDRVRRFIQEAKSASALNHPHIITIHEIGHTEIISSGDGLTESGAAGARLIHYIAMEFVAGDTLRAKIHAERTDLKKLLGYLAQVADGLAKAHQSGIVHRDLKPENVMITEDGYAKILDFGLAKLIEPQKPVNANDILEAETVMMGQTQPGLVVGTIGYMSPEQVQGKSIDQRSDIFSFGCMLYEAATGHSPFAGESVIDSLHRIVYSQAPPIGEFNPDTPVELQRIVRKCLSKSPDERYQSIRDVALDLRSLLKEYDSQPSVSFISNMPSSGMSSSGPRSAVTNVMTSGALPVKQSRSKWWIVAAALVVVAAAAAAVFTLSGRDRSRGTQGAPFQNIRVSRLTGNGKSSGATISPDGKYVVHIVSESGRQSLWVRQVATSSNVQVVPPAEADYKGMTFSPDGNYVYFVKTEKASPLGILYQVPSLGGTPKKVLEDVDSPVSFSPDGSQLVFTRVMLNPPQTTLVIANADGAAERVFATRKHPEFFAYTAGFYSGPAWSPDGKVIACGAGSTEGGSHMNVVEVRVEDGAETAITSEQWLLVGQLAWLAGGDGLVMSAVDSTSRLGQIYHLAYPGGETRRITNDLNNYNGLSLTAGFDSLVVVQYDRLSNLWVAPSADAGRARQITSGVGKYNALAWTPNGRVVYAASGSGSTDIWIMDSTGANQKQLTTDAGVNIYPAVSPDGRYIVFSSNRASAANIFNLWRMDIDGGNQRPLTKGSGEMHASISPDGRWVVYSSSSSGKSTLWKVSIDGGEPAQLTDRLTALPAVSPDGKHIACLYWDEQLTSSWDIAIIPFEGGQVVKTFKIPPGPIRWSADGSALTYIDERDGISNIWSQPLAGGQPKQLTQFKSDSMFHFAWSTDGRQLACARGIVTSDVILINKAK